MSEHKFDNSSCETIVSAKLNNSKLLTNRTNPSTPRVSSSKSNGIFRQRTFESSQISDRSSYIGKRSNTSVDLTKNNCSAESSKINVNNIHFTSLAKQTKECERILPGIHKLGTIPKYLRTPTPYTIQSNFNMKRKQFAVEKLKLYQQQKCVMDEYRRLVDMQKTINQQSGKQYTKLEELKMIVYDVKGFNLCLCMGLENYEKVEEAMDLIEETLNEYSNSKGENDGENNVSWF